MEIKKGHDEKGAYCVCPKCKEKCRYTVYAVADGEAVGWACECVKCEELLDEE